MVALSLRRWLAPSLDRIGLGSSSSGRLLAVSFTERGDDVRIISAREMEPREKISYEQGNPNTH
ncbi:MAG: BrnT family toxin [Blastocatellales bacterium]